MKFRIVLFLFLKFAHFQRYQDIDKLLSGETRIYERQRISDFGISENEFTVFHRARVRRTNIKFISYHIKIIFNNFFARN